MAKKPTQVAKPSAIADEFDTAGPEGAQVAPSDLLARLRAEIENALDLDVKAAQLEEDFKAVKKRLHDIRTKAIPDIMAEIQSDRFTYMGWDIKVEDLVAGSIPSDPEKRADALSYLESIEGGSLIKSGVVVDFPKSQAKEAQKLFAQLSKKGYTVVINQTVHAMSLAAFAREKLKSGENVDCERLGLFTGKVAKFKKVKEKKAKESGDA